jgi:predicted dehydrogenase
MSVIDRILGKEKSPDPIKIAVVGEGMEAGLLAAAYEVNQDAELVGCEIKSYGDGVIRQPVIETPPLGSLEDILLTTGLEAIEIVALENERTKLAKTAIKAGLMVSMEAPINEEELNELSSLASAYNVPLRFRLHSFYYPPYMEMKRIVSGDGLGRPVSLKMTVRRGKGTEVPENHDPFTWIRQNELGFLALAGQLMGDIELVYTNTSTSKNGTPAPLMIMWKYKSEHQYGYIQLDFCPDLHIRTFTDPVHRAMELTCIGGLAFATRGEGQMHRMPALSIRGKSTTTAFEVIEDDWRAVYKNMANETVNVLRGKKKVKDLKRAVTDSFKLIEAAKRSFEKGDEVKL